MLVLSVNSAPQCVCDCSAWQLFGPMQGLTLAIFGTSLNNKMHKPEPNFYQLQAIGQSIMLSPGLSTQIIVPHIRAGTLRLADVGALLTVCLHVAGHHRMVPYL